jgi:hypothetical protein
MITIMNYHNTIANMVIFEVLPQCLGWVGANGLRLGPLNTIKTCHQLPYWSRLMDRRMAEARAIVCYHNGQFTIKTLFFNHNGTIMVMFRPQCSR